jgi:Rrf2 family protein
MFRISRRLDYGLHLMLALAEENNDRPQSTASLSEKLQMPLPFMHQIAHALMQSGLIKATPGPRGGLRLNQQPSEISILHIVEALEGSVSLNPSLDHTDCCPRQESCVAQPVWSDLQQQIKGYLGSITLESLVSNQQQYILPVSITQQIADR